jgi:tetratricopeptide (TPR) repeat protein
VPPDTAPPGGVPGASTNRSDHPNLAGSLSNLALLLLSQQSYGEAEPLVREALAIRERAMPAGHWQRASSVSLLGELLVAQGRLEEAEPLLLAGFEGLKNNLDAPVERRRAAIESLVSRWKDRGDLEQLESWQAERDAFDRRHPAIGPAATSPATEPATMPAPWLECPR